MPQTISIKHLMIGFLPDNDCNPTRQDDDRQLSISKFWLKLSKNFTVKYSLKFQSFKNSWLTSNDFL